MVLSKFIEMESIRLELRKQGKLYENEIPKEIFELDSIPMIKSGKVNYKELEALYSKQKQ